ncbi:MAG: hypothetical protein RR585_05940 [Coprobacillus sp.]
MNYKDYYRCKIGSSLSVGMFGNDLYAFEVLIGFCNVPEYHKISKKEFDSFDSWKDDMDKLYDIVGRPVLCSGYKGNTEIQL